MPAEYTPVAARLPAVLTAERDGFTQVEGFLAMVDELNRDYLARLAELPAWLSPAGSVWPPGAPPDAGADEVLRRLEEVYDELASWFGFVFPGAWEGVPGLTRRRAFLARASRLWRRRGTPRGFVDWFCLWFGIAAAERRPFLLEHFKYGDGPPGPPPGLRATLVVPAGERFATAADRAEAVEFVRRYAPAHVLMRLCWAPEDFSPGDVPSDPGSPEAGEYRARMRELLCSLTDHLDHAGAIRLGECADDGRPEDRLDVGGLPSDPTENQ